MSEQQDTQQSSSKKPKGRKGLVLLVIVLVVILVAAGWFGWRYGRQWIADQQALTAQVTQLQNVQQQRSEASHQQLAELKQTLQGVREQVQLHRKKLSTLGKGGSILWRLHEAKSLASLAQQRLLLTADLSATYQLLKASDKVLAGIDEPRLIPARRALAQDMQKVQAAQQVDTTAILLQLGALMKQVQQVALAPSVADAPEHSKTDEVAETSWWRSLWSHLPIHLERTQGDLPLPLPASQLAQVRLALAVNLQQAQLALLQGRPAVYEQALLQGEQLVNTYLDASQPAVKAIKDQLNNLQHKAVRQAAPQIGAGLEAIKALLDQHHAADTGEQP